MELMITGVMTALWLGILTSISPCPLTTNIAAVSYIGRQVGSVRRVLIYGVLYSCGRIAAYVAVGGIVVGGLLSIPAVSMFLQRYMIMIVGPVLVLAGMFLLELIGSGVSGPDMSASAQKIAGKGGALGAFLLGVLFALSFCPVSAALFFGSLIPLAVGRGSAVILPSLYGAGTGFPVLVFSIVIAVSTKSVGVLFNRLSIFEKWARRVTGVVFIAAGIFLSLKYILFS